MRKLNSRVGRWCADGREQVPARFWRDLSRSRNQVMLSLQAQFSGVRVLGKTCSHGGSAKDHGGARLGK